MTDLFEEMKRMFDEMERMRREMERMFEKSMKQFEKIRPRTDVIETKDEIIVRMDIPGMKKDEIEIYVSPRSVEVMAEKKLAKEEKKAKYIRRERAYKGYHEYIELPVEVDPNKVETKYDGGVLEIRLRKAKESIRRKIKLK